MHHGLFLVLCRELSEKQSSRLSKCGINRENYKLHYDKAYYTSANLFAAQT